MVEGQDCLCEEGYTPGLVSATLLFHFTRDKTVCGVPRNQSTLIPVLTMVRKGPVTRAASPAPVLEGLALGKGAE